MKNPIFLALIYLMISSAGFSQEAKTNATQPPIYEEQATNINLAIADTIIPYTLIVKPTGEISYADGHDFTLLKAGYSEHRLVGQRRKGSARQVKIVPDGKETTELTSYFPPLNQDPEKFIIEPDLGVEWSPHYGAELKYSYLLNGISAPKLYESDLDSVVRIVVPRDGNDHETHMVFQIDLKQRPLQIEYTILKHGANGEFERLEQGTKIVSKNRRIAKLLTEFEELNLSPESHYIQLDAGIYYLVEYKTANGYFAGFRHYRNKEGRIPENTFPWTVQQLCWPWRAPSY